MWKGMVIKMEITLAEFKEQYLPELREQFYSAVQKSIVENKQEITEMIIPNSVTSIDKGAVGVMKN